MISIYSRPYLEIPSAHEKTNRNHDVTRYRRNCRLRSYFGGSLESTLSYEFGEAVLKSGNQQ